MKGWFELGGAECDKTDLVFSSRRNQYSQAQEQHIEEQNARSSGEDGGSEHVQITAKN